MANILNFLGYAKGASGATPFMRVYSVTLTPTTYAQNYAEILDFTKALNPNGLEDPAFGSSSTSFVPPMVLRSTLNGYTPELQIGGNGTLGQWGLNFYSGGGAQLANATAYSGIFPANGANFGLILIGFLTRE